MDIGTFASISTQVTTASLDTKNWSKVLASITDAFPGVKTHLFSQDTVNDFSNLGYTIGYDPDYLASYMEYYGALNPWAPAFARNDTGTALHSFDMCPDDQLLKTEFYSDWLLPQEDFMGGGGGVMGKTPTASALFGGNIRRSDREVLEPIWMEFVRNILPTMVQAWTINRAIALAEIERHMPVTARSVDAAVVLLRPDGYPTHVNDRAQKIIEDNQGLQQDYMGRIWISGNAMANQFVRRRKWQRKDAYFQDRLVDGSRLWIAELDPAAVSNADLSQTLGMHTPGILIVITKDRAKTDPKDKIIRRYGVTPAEADVMMALGDGLSSREIAELRGVSANTVRHQIKQCAAKCGVRRQTELAIIATRVKLSS